MNDIKIENAEIVIVGGSSGMGLALARRLLLEGANVTIVGRSQQRLEAAKVCWVKVHDFALPFLT